MRVASNVRCYETHETCHNHNAAHRAHRAGRRHADLGRADLHGSAAASAASSTPAAAAPATAPATNCHADGGWHQWGGRPPDSYQYAADDLASDLDAEEISPKPPEPAPYGSAELQQEITR